MKQLAATLSRQRGIQYEFGREYSAKKSAGILESSHLKPLSELFTESQLEEILIDNKVGENYFGQLSEQLRRKGGAAFSAIGERMVLKSNTDIAFVEGAEQMLKDKELKTKKKEIDQIDADWTKAQKDIMRSKVSFTNSEADILAREQSNKLLALCLENGKKFKYDSPVSSQHDVPKMYNKIQKLNEQDQLAIMRREVKLKKAIFSDLPSDFVLFKQLNISAKKCTRTFSLYMLLMPTIKKVSQLRKSMRPPFLWLGILKDQEPHLSQQQHLKPWLTYNGHHKEDEFVITLEEDGWKLGSVQSYNEKNDTILVQSLESLKTRAKDDKGKTYWIY